LPRQTQGGYASARPANGGFPPAEPATERPPHVRYRQ